MNEDPLGLDAETMRELGYRTIDMLVARLTDPNEPPIRRATPEEMQRRIPSTDPEQRVPIGELLGQLDRDVLPFASRDHPGYLAFVPFGSTWPGALGDLIASACNIYAGSWMESAGPSRLELEILDWFKSWIGYPPDAAGLLVSGGSTANMTALSCAREAVVGPMGSELVAYVSDQSHSSIARSARVLGFRPDQVRVLPTGSDYRLRPETLARAIDADAGAGRTPLFVCATAGATNTGAVDPLGELADVCRERDTWLHVDAAYGGFAVLTERGRRVLDGIDRADSVALDPHKWLYQPFECGCVLVRAGGHLGRAFCIGPDYLHDSEAGAGEVDFGELGTQLTRSARAIKLWLSLRYFGLDAFRAAIDRSIDLAELAVRRIEASEHLELAAPPSLSVVCFRRRFPGVEDETEVERRHWGLVSALERSELGLVATTRLRGRLAIRMCVLSHLTDAEALERVLGFLETAEAPVSAGAQPRYEREAPIEDTWAGQEPVSEAVVRSVPLFSSLSADDTERVARWARTRGAETGQTVVAQWETSRDFYVIVDGAVDFKVDGSVVGQAGTGEFFGELAAVDWGGGFSYPRLATVVAAAPTTLLMFSSAAINDLVRDYPSLAHEIRAAVRERLGRIPG